MYLARMTSFFLLLAIIFHIIYESICYTPRELGIYRDSFFSCKPPNKGNVLEKWSRKSCTSFMLLDASAYSKNEILEYFFFLLLLAIIFHIIYESICCMPWELGIYRESSFNWKPSNTSNMLEKWLSKRLELYLCY